MKNRELNDDLKRIKDLYGEKMMHLCRSLFPTLLERPLVLSNILERNFPPSRSLYYDIKREDLIDDFRFFIFNQAKENKNGIDTNMTPFELIEQAGYTLYECHTEEEIQKFRRFYKDGEALCTFTEGGRLKRCFVFFAVKRGAETLQRNDFTDPKREDAYGISVISIQIDRHGGLVSIKNRYNHAVKNPDATFGNNLERIIPGLTRSFEKYLEDKVKEITISGENNDYFLLQELKYVRGDDGKYYRYNYMVNDIYYCEDNIIVDHGKVIKRYHEEKERFLVMDYFILDIREKRIILYDESISDSFINSINTIGNIEKIVVTKNNGKKIIRIIYDGNKNVEISLDYHNIILEYTNDYVTEIGNNFLYKSNSIEKISLINVIKVGDCFLPKAANLKNVRLPKIVHCGTKYLAEYLLRSYVNDYFWGITGRHGKDDIAYNNVIDNFLGK